jgi:hypothetical protein
MPAGILEAEGKVIEVFLEQFEARFGPVAAWALEHGLDRSVVEALQATFIRSIR